MPEMPAFLANFLEPRFARRVQSTSVIELAPSLRKITFEGDSLRGVSFRAGQEVEFRVSDRAFRHYTPSAFDAARGSLEIIFFLHGDSPGASWARQLQKGQYAGVLGPGGHFKLAEDKATHVLLGDETALGLFACLANTAQGRFIGAVEVEAAARDWPSLVGLKLPAAERAGVRGDALTRWVEANELPPDDSVAFYLVGHTASIVRLRELLLRRGWPKRSIRTKPYWADGKHGL